MLQDGMGDSMAGQSDVRALLGMLVQRQVLSGSALKLLDGLGGSYLVQPAAGTVLFCMDEHTIAQVSLRYSW